MDMKSTPEDLNLEKSALSATDHTIRFTLTRHMTH